MTPHSSYYFFPFIITWARCKIFFDFLKDFINFCINHSMFFRIIPIVLQKYVSISAKNCLKLRKDFKSSSGKLFIFLLIRYCTGKLKLSVLILRLPSSATSFEKEDTLQSISVEISSSPLKKSFPNLFREGTEGGLTAFFFQIRTVHYATLIELLYEFRNIWGIIIDYKPKNFRYDPTA